MIRPKQWPSWIAWGVSLCGAMVLSAWFLDIQPLLSIRPDWATMKTSAATCFVLAGALGGLMFAPRNQHVETGVACFSISILMLMLSVLSAYMTKSHTPIDSLFVPESPDAGPLPGRPSLCTALLFSIVATCGFLYLAKKHAAIRWAGLALLMGGAVSTLGYITGEHALICTLGGTSNAMALHTSVLFALLGLSFTRASGALT